jgi:hypothetical protein
VKQKLKPGDTVRVIGSKGTSKIRAILTDVHGALLKTQIDGFRLWNLDEFAIGEAKPQQGEMMIEIPKFLSHLRTYRGQGEIVRHLRQAPGRILLFHWRLLICNVLPVQDRLH